MKESELFIGSYYSLLKVVHNLGFEHKTVNRKKLLLEMSDVSCRYVVIKKIKKKTYLVWIDETWVDAGHNVSKGWTGGTTEASNTA